MLEIMLAFILAPYLQEAGEVVPELRSETRARLCGTAGFGLLSTPVLIGDVDSDGVSDWAILSREKQFRNDGILHDTVDRVVIASGESLSLVRDFQLVRGFKFMATVAGVASACSVVVIDDIDRDGVCDFAICGVLDGASTVVLYSAKTG